MNICGIYKITSPLGRVYIGQSIDIHRRWNSYKKLHGTVCSQKKLYRSLSKYRPENHLFEIIEECDKSMLNNREYHWQCFYDVTSDNGLNCLIVDPNENTLIKKSFHKIMIELNIRYRVFLELKLAYCKANKISRITPYDEDICNKLRNFMATYKSPSLGVPNHSFKHFGKEFKNTHRFLSENLMKSILREDFIPKDN